MKIDTDPNAGKPRCPECGYNGLRTVWEDNNGSNPKLGKVCPMCFYRGDFTPKA